MSLIMRTCCGCIKKDICLNFAFALFQVIKPHIPLIKFRKAGMPGTLASPAAAPVSTPAPAAAVVADIPLAAAAATSSAFKTTQMPVREWWDTPSRFKRRQVDTLECDLINVRMSYYPICQ